jgi:hypothetical protein
MRFNKRAVETGLEKVTREKQVDEQSSSTVTPHKDLLPVTCENNFVKLMLDTITIDNDKVVVLSHFHKLAQVFGRSEQFAAGGATGRRITVSNTGF